MTIVTKIKSLIKIAADNNNNNLFLSALQKVSVPLYNNALYMIQKHIRWNMQNLQNTVQMI